MTPRLCACAVVITLEMQKCRKRAPHSVEFNFFIKGAVLRYSVIFCTFFARAKNGCCSRECHGYQLGQPREQLHRPSRVKQMSFSSSNCRFPRPSLVAAIIFPHTKWLPKIIDYRDPAALIAIDRNGFRRMKEEGRSTKFCLRFFFAWDLVMIFQG